MAIIGVTITIGDTTVGMDLVGEWVGIYGIAQVGMAVTDMVIIPMDMDIMEIIGDGIVDI